MGFTAYLNDAFHDIEKINHQNCFPKVTTCHWHSAFILLGYLIRLHVVDGVEMTGEHELTDGDIRDPGCCIK